MRNPFEKVYCEDCDHCLLATYEIKKYQLKFAQCKAAEKKRCVKKMLSKELNSIPMYYYCESVRWMGRSFCFKFKPKVEESKK